MSTVSIILEQSLSELDEKEFQRMYLLLKTVGGTERQMYLLDKELIRRNLKGTIEVDRTLN